MTDITNSIDALNRAFGEFKAANDLRLQQIEAKGSADPITEGKVDAINSEITKLRGELAEVEKKAARPTVAETVDIEKKAHAEAFNGYARKGRDDGLADLQYKAMSLTGADGGYAVPEVIDAAIAQRLLDISPIRGLATVVTTSTSDYKKLVNRRGADGSTLSGWVGETAARTATDTPKMAEISVPMGEVYANPAATQAILDDAMFDIDAFLGNEIAEEIARAENKAFVDGTGTNQPRGFLSGTTAATADATRAHGTIQHIAANNTTALPTSFDKYVDLAYSLKAGHRAGAVWIANRSTLAEMRKVKDSTGQYLWQPTVILGQPDVFMGFGVVEAEDMPSAGTANALPLAFGNFKAGYLIVDRFGIRVLRDPYSNKPYVHFYSTKRLGGCVVDSEAIKVLKLSAS